MKTENIVKRMKENNPMFNKEIVKKVNETRKKNGVYERTRERMRKDNPMKDSNIAEKVSRVKKGKHCSPDTEFKKGCVSPRKGKNFEELFGKQKADEIKDKQSKSKKELYDSGKLIPPNLGKTKENSEHFKKISKLMKNGGGLKARMGNRIRPNRPEILLKEIIEKNNLPFNYVGDGKIWFRGEHHSFNPDFLSKNPKHIIEVFGDYWHKNKKELDKERIETYAKYGYKTLIIGDKELRDQDVVINKIKNFINF